MAKHTHPIRNLKNKIVDFFRENALDLFPIRHSFHELKPRTVACDLKAALNVTLLTLPQGMAYAAIAELPIYYGIVCSIIAGIIAPLFSSSRFTILGPTNATAFMVFSFFISHPEIDQQSKLLMMPLLVFMVGFFSIAGAYLKLADLLQYVSRSVLVGYITGAAILIIANQAKHLVGIAEPMSEVSAKTFFSILKYTVEFWDHYQWQPILIGGIALSAYLVLQKRFSVLPNFAITLTIVSVLTKLLAIAQPRLFENIDTFSAFQNFAFTPSLPLFDFDTLSSLFGVAIAVTFLASLENTVMGKSLGSRVGERPNVNQDMFSVGMSNIFASLLAPMPASASLTRSALNFDSGAKSRFASIYSAMMCLAGFWLLIKLPIVENIPKSALAGLVIGIAISLINWHNIKICLRSTSDDALVILTTFTATLITRLDYAIFAGVALSITLFLRRASKPHLIEYEMSDEGNLRELDKKKERPLPAISIVHVEGDLFFGAAELFSTQVQRTASDPNLKVIILRLKNARHLDATSVMALEGLVKHMHAEGRFILISGASREVYKVLKHSGVLETVQKDCDRSLGETNVFIYSPSNPNLSTRDALIRAQELLGTNKADIKIFYDPAHK
ncbi:SulP family inorganic anion transporter [Rubritalea marina]|uniref:SulP family inorganic anion transporter n=1 Tax=Rubritalea marina TaxID=361055 RepID=UPI000382AE01|nr:SulP family inorganic anion transporter [Rubritalea marina]